MCYYQLYHTLAFIPKLLFKFKITTVALNPHFRPQNIARAQPLGSRVMTSSAFLLTPNFGQSFLQGGSV